MSPAGVGRSFFVAFLVLLCLKSSCAGNITSILKGYPAFSKMTEVLSQPDVTKQMSIQPAITILALDNDAMDKISAAKRPEEVTDIVKCHVVFDYYDEPKLNNRPLNKPAEMVNLYQSSGSSQYGQGLVQVKKTSGGIVFFSTSTNSTTNDAKFVEKVYTRQFNVSIVKIDHPIYIVGLNDDMAPAPAPLPRKAGPPKTAPAPAPEEEVVAESPSDNSTYTTAPTPAPASDADDADVDADDADSPSNKNGTDADDQASDARAASSAEKGVVGLALVFASTFLAAVAF